MAKAYDGVIIATEIVCPACGGVEWQKNAGTNEWHCPTDGYERAGTASWSEKGHN